MRSAVCDRARAWVSLDLDGGLSTFEKRLLDRHLDACDDCRGFADESAQFTLALREAALEPARIEVEVPHRGSILSSAIAGVGSIAAVAAAAVLAFGPHSSSQPQQTRASGVLASGLATLATTSDTLGVPQHTLPRETPRLVGEVRGTFGVPA